MNACPYFGDGWNNNATDTQVIGIADGAGRRKLAGYYPLPLIRACRLIHQARASLFGSVRQPISWANSSS